MGEVFDSIMGQLAAVKGTDVLLGALVIGSILWGVAWVRRQEREGRLFPPPPYRVVRDLSELATFNRLHLANQWVRVYGGCFHRGLGGNRKFADMVRERGSKCPFEVVFGPDVDVRNSAILKAFKEAEGCRVYLVPESRRATVQVRRLYWWPRWRLQHFLVADGKVVTIEARHGLLFPWPKKAPGWHEYDNNPELASYYEERFRAIREGLAVELDKGRLVAEIVSKGRFVDFLGEFFLWKAKPRALARLARELGEPY